MSKVIMPPAAFICEGVRRLFSKSERITCFNFHYSIFIFFIFMEVKQDELMNYDMDWALNTI